MKIAENIRALRREKGLTQEQLAGVLGVTTGAVYKWEAGLSQPELGKLAGIADFFDTYHRLRGEEQPTGNDCGEIERVPQQKGPCRSCGG